MGGGGFEVIQNAPHMGKRLLKKRIEGGGPGWKAGKRFSKQRRAGRGLGGKNLHKIKKNWGGERSGGGTKGGAKRSSVNYKEVNEVIYCWGEDKNPTGVKGGGMKEKPELPQTCGKRVFKTKNCKKKKIVRRR